jgi:hypothetical protein
MTVVWDAASCSVQKLIDILEVFIVYIIGAVRKLRTTVNASETSIVVYQTTGRNIPEHSHVHTRCHENRKPRPEQFTLTSAVFKNQNIIQISSLSFKSSRVQFRYV